MAIKILRSSLLRIYLFATKLLLACVVAFLSWRILSYWPQLVSIEPRWNTPWFIGALISGLLAYNCPIVGFLILLKRTNLFKIGYIAQYFRVWWVSYLYRYIPGKMFVLVERARMGSAIGIPPVIGAALAVVETFITVSAGLWLSLLTVSYYASDVDRILVPLALISTTIFLLLPLGLRVASALPIVAKKFPELSYISLSYRDIMFILLPYLLYYLFAGLSFFMISHMIFPLSWAVLPGLCGVFALSHIVGLLVLVAPGGVGVRETMLIAQLGYLMPIGVTEAVTVAARVWFTSIELALYLSVIAICPRVPDVNLTDHDAVP